MSMSTLIQPERETEGACRARPAVAEWLVSMGPVVHRLDYGGRVAAVGRDDGRAVAALAAAYPLAELDAVEGSDLAPASYDLVCLLHGLADRPDPVGAARTALCALRPDGALMVVEPTRPDSFFDGPIAVGAWLLRAGAARARLASSTAQGFVLDARPTL